MIASTNYQYDEEMETERLEDKNLFLDFFSLVPRENCIAAGHFTDVVTGIEQDDNWFLYDYQGFCWSTCDLYHFERYDLKLRDDFKAFVRSKVNA